MSKQSEYIAKRKAEVVQMREKLQKELEELQGKTELYKGRANKAASENNLEGYKAAKKDAEDITAQIEITQYRLDNLPGVTKTEIAEYWLQYASGFEKEMSKEQKELNRLKAEIVAVFRRMLLLQNEALKERNVFCGFLGLAVPEWSVIQEQALNEALPMAFIDGGRFGDLECVGFRGVNVKPEHAMYMYKYPNANSKSIALYHVPIDPEKI